MRPRLAIALALSMLATGCSTDSKSPAPRSDAGAKAGATSTGGKNATGGTSSANGGSSTGSGGGPAVGGSTGSGGATGSGGTGNTSSGGGGAGGGGAGGRGAGGRGAGGSAGISGNDGGQTEPDSGAPHIVDHYVTFYGWPDNDPAGNGIAYPKLHQGASGTGTHADPITFATDPKEYAPGTILYVPYLKRYVIMEDSCAECITDWKSGKYHIDLWLDSDGTKMSQVLACENTLTRESTPVEVDPPADRPVISTPLFDIGTGTCNPP